MECESRLPTHPVDVFFDAGIRNGICAGAYYIHLPQRPFEAKLYLETNINYAEFRSAVEALEAAAIYGCRNITLYGDSQYAIETLERIRKTRYLSAKIPFRKHYLLSIIDSFASLEFVWVPREANHVANKLVEEAIFVEIYSRPAGRS